MPNIFCQQNMLEIGGICNMPQYWLAPKFEKIKHSLHLTNSHVENPFSASPICKKKLTPSCLYYIVTSRVHRSAEPLYLVTSAVVFIQPARAGPKRACALRALGLLLADVGWGKTFWRAGRFFLRKEP